MAGTVLNIGTRSNRLKGNTEAAKNSKLNLTPPVGLRLGLKMRHARLTLGLRLQDVADKAGCSEGLLSKIEHDTKQPSLNMLHRIAEALQTTVGMLCSTQDDMESMVSRAGKRVVVEMDPLRKGTGLKLERLIPYNNAHLLQGNIHIIDPFGGSDGAISHEGEEVVFVLEGRIQLTVSDQNYILDKEDSFLFCSELPHSYQNLEPVRARVIFINTPPSF